MNRVTTMTTAGGGASAGAAAMTSPPERAALAGGVLHIDLKALADNWRFLGEKAAPATCAATVKADAYGLGLEPVARTLWNAGCRTYFVALPHEGAALRAILPEAVIYVLDGLFSGEAPFYGEHGLRPALAGPEEIAEWADYCGRCEARLPAAVHIDTGISRLGLSEGDVRRLAGSPDLLASFRMTLVMSHLACGDEPGNEMNERQRRRFDALRALLPDAPASLANSPGTFLGEGFTHDLVRPGVALYGGNPFSNRPNPMKPVVSLYAPILQVRHLQPGETVGYSATWKAARPTRLAILGVGYADGYLRALSWPAQDGPAQVVIGGQYAPVVGRVSMDSITVDVTDIDEDFARRGVRAELLGAHITVDELAKWAGTISYEILTSLGLRYTRLHAPAES